MTACLGGTLVIANLQCVVLDCSDALELAGGELRP
jgi:hypothetical protein